MKPKILIIKTGSTLPTLLERKGDFEDWIIARYGEKDVNWQVVNVQEGEPLPNYPEIDGIIITGSHDMVTERLDWSEQTAAWLAGAVGAGVPTLGICYGHQLLAHALGGEVVNNPKGREMGTVEFFLEDIAGQDNLFANLPTSKAHVCHTQTVLRLPPQATRLAHSEMDGNLAFVVGRNTWGVQFHPEFDAEIGREYIRQFRPLILQGGQDPDQMESTCEDTDLGPEILKRFIHVVKSTN